MFIFEEPIVGGITLLRPAIQSPGYVTRVSGWTINQDGSAEFNNLVVRGTFNGTDWVANSTGLFFYSPTEALGNLSIAIAPNGGPGPFGESVPQGVTAFSGGGQSLTLLGAQLSYDGGGFISEAGSSPFAITIGGAPLNILSTILSNLVAVQPGTASTAENWHAISLTGAPSGTTGTARVQVIPIANAAILDIEIGFTALGAQANFTIGTLPSAAYYPPAQRHFPVGAAGTETGTPQPRVLLPVSGGIQLVDLPAGMSGLGICQIYPLS